MNRSADAELVDDARRHVRRSPTGEWLPIQSVLAVGSLLVGCTVALGALFVGLLALSLLPGGSLGGGVRLLALLCVVAAAPGVAHWVAAALSRSWSA